MSTYTQILYQIVFSTKNRNPCFLNKQVRQKVYKYIWGILQSKRCHPYCINGVEDHLHIITHLHQSESLSNVIKDIKLASSLFIKDNKLLTHFTGWQEGYGAFTYGINERNNLIEYVKNQEEHHKLVSFEEEYRNLLLEHNIIFEEKYLF